MNATEIRRADADAVCDAFLDGPLSQEARWEFDRRMMRDGELAATVTRQRDIDAAVRRTQAVPDLGAMLARVEAAAAAQSAAPEAWSMRTAPLADAMPWIRRFVQCAAAVLIFSVWMWTSGSPDEVRTDVASLRAYESNLVEAMALGVAGAAAIVGSRRLSKGLRGRFVLEEHGIRMLLPEGVEEAIAFQTAGLGTAVVYREAAVERAVLVVADRAPADHASLRGRRLGDHTVYELAAAPAGLAGFATR